MTQCKLHTLETTPEDSKEILERALKQIGFIPNFDLFIAFLIIKTSSFSVVASILIV